MMIKILVTGGTGYIGSHTVVALQEKGYKVIIADNLSNSNADTIHAIAKITGVKPELEVVDLSCKTACDDLFSRHSDLKAVIHFAAAKAVGESVLQPLFYYENNLCALLNVLQNMARIGCGNIVFSSSCTVYGQPKELPVQETSPRLPATCPYGNTKQIAEDILRDVAKASLLGASPLALSVLALRYFNPIGAHSSALIGELPNGVPNNLMPYITQTAAGLRSCLQVYGNDYNTSDGTPIRDYIHVSDLAEAHLCAMEYLLSGKVKGIDYINLGTGKGYTVLEVIQSFEKMSGIKLNYKIVARREGDIEKIWGNVDKARQILNWQAKREIDEMTLSAWKWQQYISTGLLDK
ncbi:MAG: UDP-glucose 4-epimerase GalE [Bacteroidales bacterium]